MASEPWSWRLVGKATDDYQSMDPSNRARLADKLDEIVDHPWRDPIDWPSRSLARPTIEFVSEIGAAQSLSNGRNG